MHPIAALATSLLALGRQTSPTGSGGATLPPSMTQGINTIIGWVKYVGYGTTAIGLIAAAATMAIAHHRGTIGEHGGKLMFAIGGTIVIAAAMDIIGVLAK
jgi:hypothetical protein